MSAKITTFAAKFNKKLADKRHKKDCRSSLSCLVEKVLRVLKVLRVKSVNTSLPLKQQLCSA